MRKNVPVSKKVARILITIVIILVTLVMIVPFVWMISASFKTEADVMKIPIEWIPKYFYPDNYKRVLSIGTTSSTNYHFGLAYFNSIKCFWQQPDCFIIWKSCFAKKYRDQWK